MIISNKIIIYRWVLIIIFYCFIYMLPYETSPKKKRIKRLPVKPLKPITTNRYVYSILLQNFAMACLFCVLKPCTHDQICIRMQILHICKICIRTQIWPCVRIYSRMQNLHVCKSWKICTCLRPSANLILRIRKICVYANLVM